MIVHLLITLVGWVRYQSWWDYRRFWRRRFQNFWRPSSSLAWCLWGSRACTVFWEVTTATLLTLTKWLLTVIAHWWIEIVVTLRNVCKFLECKIHHCWLLCRLEFRLDFRFVDKSLALSLDSVVSRFLEVSSSYEVRCIHLWLCF